MRYFQALIAMVFLLISLGHASAATSTVHGVVYDAGDDSTLDSSDNHLVQFSGVDATMISVGGYYELFGASYGGLTVTASADGYESASVAPYAVLGGGYSYELNFSLPTSPPFSLSAPDTSLDENQTETISISGAAANTDYDISTVDSDLVTLSKSTVRTNGSGDGSFTVTAIDDDIWRGGGSESVGILVSHAGSGAHNSITLSVADDAGDEPDRVVVVIAATEVAEDASTTGYVELRRGSTAKKLESGSVTVTLGISGAGSLNKGSTSILADTTRSSDFTITPTNDAIDAPGGSLTITPSETAYGIHTADSVTVADDDHTPVASNNGISVDEDMSIDNGDLNDHSSDADGDSLTYAIDSDVTNGDLVLDGDTGLWTYSPDADWNGVDSFVFTASDGTQSDSGTVTITVDPINDAPLITEGDSTDVTMTTNGASSTLTPFDLTLNATDSDGDELTWSISSVASNGTATASETGTSKAIGYTPDLNYVGSDSFIVRVFDGVAADTITVHVTVDPERVIFMGVLSGYTWTMTPGPTDGEPALDGDTEEFDPVEADTDQELEAVPAGGG